MKQRKEKTEGNPANSEENDLHLIYDLILQKQITNMNIKN